MTPTRRKCRHKHPGAKKRPRDERGFSTREVAKICGLTARQVQALARAGCVGAWQAAMGPDKRPARRGAAPLCFSFQDLQVLRRVRGLLGLGLPLRRLARSLRLLRGQLARRRVPLSGAVCSVENGRLVANDGSYRWDVESGIRETLAPGPLASVRSLPMPAQKSLGLPAVPAHPFARERAWPRPAHVAGQNVFAQADTWFNRGLDAETSAPSRASSFYLQAIACNPEHVEAMINLGHLCAAERDSQRAAAFFRLATRVDPEHPVAHFNLAVVLHDGGACGAAMQAYRKALLLDPNFADAHFNLGTLLAQQGHDAEAGTHFLAFRAATQSSPTTP